MEHRHNTYQCRACNSQKEAERPSDAAACSLLVVVEGEGSNSRIQIKVAHQSFALEYQNDEPGAMEWFAGQVRSALAKAGTNVAENGKRLASADENL